ncbi:hypothetical protein [Pedobacter sp. MW01-1-1]|uniref:hypothetical protein n=1 Tax=Pedobacter sp. MW01-1-1 TaxID=3383027 RepID=UPI003FF0DE26
MLLFAGCYGSRAQSVSSFTELAKQYQNGDHTESLRSNLVNASNSESAATLKDFLMNQTSESSADAIFLEQLTSICLLKIPQKDRYLNQGKALFMQFVKLGENNLLSDFFKQWDLNAKDPELKTYVQKLTANYVQNYLEFYNKNYVRLVAFAPDWVTVSLKYYELPKEEDYKEKLTVIKLFSDNKIDDLIRYYNQKYMVTGNFSSDLTEQYFGGSVGKMILVNANLTQTEEMIGLLSAKPAPQELNYLLLLFKGKKKHIEFYQAKNN